MSAVMNRARQDARTAPRHTTVLFAEVSAAQHDTYLDALGCAAEVSGGRVLHRRANSVLALFATANAAAAAAARMQAYTDTLETPAQHAGLRIGLHAGPVGQRDQDIFGDTVNLALLVAEEAKDGQVLVTHDTASGLSPALQNLVRPSGHLAAGARVGRVLVGELAWRRAIAATRDVSASARTVLEVSYGERKVVRRRHGDAVLIGRDYDCDLVVEGARASRRHCTIQRRGADLLLSDISTNGTFVSGHGADEIHVRGSELILPASGAVSLGQPAAPGFELVRFACA